MFRRPVRPWGRERVSWRGAAAILAERPSALDGAQACLDQVDCTQQNDGKFTLDADGSVECWTDKTQADGSMAHNLKVLVAMWSFGLYFPVAVRAV